MIDAKASATERLGQRPNILVIMCDEMRYPPVYENEALAAFRAKYLPTQERLRRHGMEFKRHYIASTACAPSRTTIYTGQYPSLHGVSNTPGAAKLDSDPACFWLDPNGVPTIGSYFRAGGYRTFWTGKWHASFADLVVPGTHTGLTSYQSDGAPDPEKEALYREANRLDEFGFDGWIGPEPHGTAPNNSASSAAIPPNASADARSGRDQGFADQAVALLEQLGAQPEGGPWLSIVSFLNPHDITLYGLLGGASPAFDFSVDDTVPEELFDDAFDASAKEDLDGKPSCQKSYQTTYKQWIQPITDWKTYFRLYYQLQKNVDAQMARVLDALEANGLADNTIVLFTSDHGDLLGAHGYLHQKWYQAYEESVHVPLIVSNPKLFPEPTAVDTVTSHVDLVPTLLGLAGLDADAIRQRIAPRYTDALPLVGRDLSGLVLGEVAPDAVRDPVYFMTDDDPSRGMNQTSWTGREYDSVIQPNHIETVVAVLDDGKLWKYYRHFDNPQFWSAPGTPGANGVEDVTERQVRQPSDDEGTKLVLFQQTVKLTPAPEEYEMYCVTDDPLELTNRAGATYAESVAAQATLSAMLAEQSAAKRLTPQSGTVPGEPAAAA